MKVSRPLLIGLAVLVLVLVLAAGAAFSPAVQRWAVLRAARSQPGLELQLERIAAGPGKFEVRGLRLRQAGLTLDVESAEGEYRLLPLLAGTRLELGSIVARGVVIDAASATPAAGAAAPAAAPGALGQVELPWELVIGRCDIEGRVHLPAGAERAPLATDFTLTGGGVAPGREGALELRAMLRNPAPEARVGTLRTEATLRLTQTRQRTFSRVSVAANLEAEGRRLNGPARLKLDAVYDRQASGQTYSLRTDSLSGEAAANLLSLRLELPAGATAYTGTWSLQATRAQVEPFYLAGDLPDFEATGEGSVSFAPASSNAALHGRLDVAARSFERLDPGLRALGRIRLQSTFDLAQENGVARLNALQVGLSGESPVMEIRAAQPVALDLKKRRVQVGNGAGEVARIRLLGVPLAWVRPFVSAADVSGGAVTGELVVSSDGSQLSARTVSPLRIDRVDLVQAGESLLTGAQVSASLQAEIAAGAWQARIEQLKLSTPAGDHLEAELALSAPAASERLEVTGRYQARLPTLLQPHLDGLQVQADGVVELALTGPALELGKLTSRVQTLDGRPVLTTEVRQPFTYTFSSQAIATAGGEAELMRVELGRIALGPLLGRLAEGIAGTVTQGSFALETADGGWRLRPIQPVVVADFELAQDGQPALGGVTVQLAPRLARAADGRISADVADLAVRTADGLALATVKADFSQSAAESRAQAAFQLELPALGRLPAFAAARPLSAGRAAGEIRALVDGTGEQVEARVTINGLVARDGGSALPVANISLRALRRPDGAATVEVPVLLDRAGVRSDMRFDATLTRGGAGHVLKAKLSGAHAALDDVAAVIAVFSAAAGESPSTPDAGAARAVGAPIKADEAAPWARLAGEVGLEFKTLAYGPEWTATDLRGTLQVDRARISLPIVEAGFGERGRLEAHGELVFEGGARPYRLGGGLELSEFDAGPLFRAIDAGRPPTVEGRFAVAGRFAGEGRTIDETLARTRGEFQLTSRQGVFRGLKRGTEKVSVATRAVELGAALGSIFGSDKVRGAAEKVAGGAYFADQLAQEFGELKYDQLNVRVERGESLDVKLSEVALISPEVRLVGQGTVTYVEGRPLLDQPLNVELNLGARGKVESLLERANLLLGPTSKDDLGYARAKYPIVIAGTMARPDALSFYTRLATSKLLDSVTPEN